MGKYKLTSVNSLTAKQPQNNWLLRQYFEKESLGLFFGPPASAKSFIALEIAFCIAIGQSFNDTVTTTGSVVYLAGEGFNGLSKRFKALEQKYQVTASNIFISDLPAELTNRKNAQKIVTAIVNNCPNPELIIVDTLNRNFGNGDENSTKDMGEFIYIITAMMKYTGASILLVHHCGHGASDRARGSSALKGAMDVEYKISKDNDVITMECTKAKDFEEPAPLSFNLVTQQIPDWLDDEGQPIESAILRPIDYVAPERKVSFSERELLTLNALEALIDVQGINIPDSITNDMPELKGSKYVHKSDWRTEVYALLEDEALEMQAKQKAFARAIKKLEKESKVNSVNDYYFLEK